MPRAQAAWEQLQRLEREVRLQRRSCSVKRDSHQLRRVLARSAVPTLLSIEAVATTHVVDLDSDCCLPSLHCHPDAICQDGMQRWRAEGAVGGFMILEHAVAHDRPL